jgi:Protein of unknown function (DUF1194)
MSSERSGRHGRIALGFVACSSAGRHDQLVPWTLIDGMRTAHQFPEKLLQAPGLIPGFTSISGAIGHRELLSSECHRRGYCLHYRCQRHFKLPHCCARKASHRNCTSWCAEPFRLKDVVDGHFQRCRAIAIGSANRATATCQTRARLSTRRLGAEGDTGRFGRRLWDLTTHC